MLKIEATQVVGFDAAIRGMRNPKNSWHLSDSHYEQTAPGWVEYIIGPNDHKLMMSLAKGGPVHAKYRRMIEVYADFTAPMYWWKEFDTYKVGTVRNSCSTMHKIHVARFEPADFSCDAVYELGGYVQSAFEEYLEVLEYLRDKFNETNEKVYWRALIQMLPDSFNMKATVMLSYEVLCNIIRWRANHKLTEWHTFCDWIRSLPYSEIITIAAEDCGDKKGT